MFEIHYDPRCVFVKADLFECGHRVAYEASGSSSFSGTIMVDRWAVCSTRLKRKICTFGSLEIAALMSPLLLLLLLPWLGPSCIHVDQERSNPV